MADQNPPHSSGQNHYDYVVVVSNDLTYDRRMIRTCETLVAEGYSVLLIGRQLTSSKPLVKKSFDQERVTCRYHQGPLFYMTLLQRLRKCIQQYEYDHLLLTDLDTALLVRMIRKKNVRFILDLHEYFEHVPELKGSPMKRKIWDWVARRSVSYMDTCYTVNQSLADIFSERYGVDFGVIRNVGLRKTLIERPHLNLPIKTVYLGVLNPGRGLEELITVIKSKSDIELHLIGSGPLEQELKELAHGAANIYFHGYSLPREISTALRGMHFGWNLLDDTSQSYYYSLANKFFDYIHHGIPVLTMDFPEYRRIIDEKKCGALVRRLKRSTLKKMVDQLKEDFPENWKSLHTQCQVCSKEYNWANESPKLLRILSF